MDLNTRRSVWQSILTVVLLILVLASCGGNDDPTDPDPDTGSKTGTIVVDQTPDGLNGAGWALFGPRDPSGSGDTILTGMPAGNYALVWDTVSGYITPANDTLTLLPNHLITFTGIYVEEPPTTGTIEINQTPNTLAGAGWSLTGPQNRSGSGDVILTDMPPGRYALTWLYVSGCNTPPTAIRNLNAGLVLRFNGIYWEDLVTIPAGTFTMGSPTDEPGRYTGEIQHTVTLTTPFLMSSSEVTNWQYAALAQWAYDNGHCTATSTGVRDALDGSTRELLDLDSVNSHCQISFRDGVFSVWSIYENHPMLGVSWYGAAAYCDWLSLQTGLPRAYNHATWQCNNHDPYGARGYRLPTEAEWEYACRAGTQTPFHTGECLDAGTEASYNGENPYPGCPSGPNSRLVQVRSYPPNAFGVYDMHGNVWEWCNDWYGAYGIDVTDPAGPWPGDRRVYRGGADFSEAQACRSASRYSYPPHGAGSSYFGFRPVRSIN